MPLEHNPNKDFPSVEERITAIEATLTQATSTSTPKSPTTETTRKPNPAPPSQTPEHDSSQDNNNNKNKTDITAAKDKPATVEELAAKVTVLEFMSETDKLVILELGAHIVQLMDEKESSERVSADLLARLKVSEEICSVLRRRQGKDG